MSSSNGTLFWVVFLVVFVGLIVGAIVLMRKRAAQNAADGVLHTLELTPTALRITETELIEGYVADGPRHSLRGLHASVEDSGTVNRRMTATRMLALGPLAAALPKRLDDRSLYLTIEGPDTLIVREISLKKNAALARQAREFAARINHLGGGHSEPETTTAAPVATTSARLEELGRLRDAGHITHEEFDTKRAEILNDL